MYSSRLQNLAISLDKVKHFLEGQPGELKSCTPMQILTEEEVIDFLWRDSTSVMKRLCKAGLETFKEKDDLAYELFCNLKQELKLTAKYTTLAAVKEAMKECCIHWLC